MMSPGRESSARMLATEAHCLLSGNLQDTAAEC